MEHIKMLCKVTYCTSGYHYFYLVDSSRKKVVKNEIIRTYLSLPSGDVDTDIRINLIRQSKDTVKLAKDKKIYESRGGKLLLQTPDHIKRLTRGDSKLFKDTINEHDHNSDLRRAQRAYRRNV